VVEHLSRKLEALNLNLYLQKKKTHLTSKDTHRLTNEGMYSNGTKAKNNYSIPDKTDFKSKAAKETREIII
jgi:hypothetical protein